MKNQRTVSIAIETSCRAGGLLLAAGEHVEQEIRFDAAARHTTALLTHLAEMVKQAGLKPQDIDEVYVSVGPGGFTGLRVGITVARTLAQAIAGLKCVAVPTPAAVAENARGLDWQHLAVILDAGGGRIHATLFTRRGQTIEPANLSANGSESRLWTPAEFLAAAPWPLLLTGEGLAYHAMSAAGVSVAPSELHLPTAAGVWAVGARMARAGHFTEYHRLLPIYARGPHITTPAGGGAGQGPPKRKNH
ncbi:MAG: tRNA (adenosine(37)-N6)-threonylcarbamoyltransferase complex dimerization subunit type 1 TsaB [Phycisphaerae bacterium]|jgi:tRNA threonylcarbamoyl adenosine modification protein YeaZ